MQVCRPMGLVHGLQAVGEDLCPGAGARPPVGFEVSERVPAMSCHASSPGRQSGFAPDGLRAPAPLIGDCLDINALACRGRMRDGAQVRVSPGPRCAVERGRRLADAAQEPTYAGACTRTAPACMPFAVDSSTKVTREPIRSMVSIAFANWRTWKKMSGPPLSRAMKPYILSV